MKTIIYVHITSRYKNNLIWKYLLFLVEAVFNYAVMSGQVARANKWRGTWKAGRRRLSNVYQDGWVNDEAMWCTCLSVRFQVRLLLAGRKRWSSESVAIQRRGVHHYPVSREHFKKMSLARARYRRSLPVVQKGREKGKKQKEWIHTPRRKFPKSDALLAGDRTWSPCCYVHCNCPRYSARITASSAENPSVHRCSFPLPVVQDTPSGLAADRFPRHAFRHDGRVGETEHLLIGICILMIITVGACGCSFMKARTCPSSPSWSSHFLRSTESYASPTIFLNALFHEAVALSVYTCVCIQFIRAQWGRNISANIETVLRTLFHGSSSLCFIAALHCKALEISEFYFACY